MKARNFMLSCLAVFALLLSHPAFSLGDGEVYSLAFSVLVLNQSDYQGQIDSCDNTIFLNISKTVFNSSEQVIFRNQLQYKQANFSIEYWVVDNEGKIIRQKKTTKNLLQKSATFSVKTATIYTIKNHLIIAGCSDRPSYYSEKMITIKSMSNASVDEDENETKDNAVLKKEKGLLLKSFYTRAKNPNSKINVFVNIEGSGNCTLIIKSPAQTIKENLAANKSLKKQYEIMLAQGENNITAELLQSKYETQKLSINAIGIQNPDIEQENSALSSNTEDSATDSAVQSSEQPAYPLPKKSSSNFSGTQGLGQISGNVVFESSTAKRNKIIIYLLLGAVLLAGLFIIMKKL
ncbi:MAG: hypothetical protein V1659_02755 [Candidatus Woesearchaeota archaeon]